jgi:RNA polymerase sigma factor (sigma-70 family)
VPASFPTPLVQRLCRSAAADRLADLPDAELLDRFRAAADHAAFEAIVRRHGSLVLAACRRVLADEADVEDAFQAAFLVLLENPRVVRSEASVGNWLYGVARRVALQAKTAAARRQAREQSAPARGPAPPPDLSWQEACDALHGELDRLPAKYRRPIWLCYFEGRTRDEAAAALGCSPGAVKGHLERGRELLRNRLAKRGIALSAGLLFATLRTPAAALPPRLIQLAVGAATDPPPTLTTLARGVAMAGLKTRWPALAACLAGLVGLAVAAVPGPAAAPTPSAPAARPADSLPAANADPVPAEERTISGTVTGPDGQPVPGAKVYLIPRTNREKPAAETIAAADGSFRLAFDPERVAGWVGADESWRDAGLIAVADGFGPAWTRVGDVTQSRWQARLLVDDVPIEGTIRNLEGRPVAGVEVSVSFIRDWDLPEQLDEYLREVKTGKARYLRARYWWGGIPGRVNACKTDAGGRFTITGLGRDRLVTLKVGGSGIAWTGLAVLTRPGQPIEGKEYPSPRAPAFTVYPATFDLPLPPGRTVSGVVKDEQTGEPVPGMRVRIDSGAPETTSDAEGRFSIGGVGKGTGREERPHLTASPGTAAPTYLSTRFELPAGDPGLGEQNVDVRVQRGIPVRAKVIDKGTGQLVEADVSYFAVYPNDQVPATLGGWNASLPRQPDGTYLGGALPGPGAVVVRRFPRRYVPATASQKAYFKLDRMPNVEYGGSADDLWVAGYGGFAPNPLPVRQFQAVGFINPAKGAAGVDVTLELDPGETKTLRLVDPDGKPLSGVRWKEYIEDSWSDPLPGSHRNVMGIGRGWTRFQFFRHEDKMLAAVIEVKGDTSTPATVMLKPWATVTGRLPADLPDRSAGQVIYGLPDYVVADKEGRFRIEKLPPDHPFDVWVGRDGIRLGQFLQPVVAKPGEHLDLGEVKLKPRK